MAINYSTSNRYLDILLWDEDYDLFLEAFHIWQSKFDTVKNGTFYGEFMQDLLNKYIKDTSQ